jgi:hypothetical protein
MQDQEHSLSLSPPPIQRKTLPDATFFPVAFLLNAKVIHPSTHRLALPLGDSSRVANPYFLALLLP